MGSRRGRHQSDNTTWRRERGGRGKSEGEERVKEGEREREGGGAGGEQGELVPLHQH